MAWIWDGAAVLNVASGALMAVLGTALLLANPRKDWNRLFGLLAVFWGAQILSANTVRLTTDGTLAALAGQLGLAFLIPLYFFLVAFAAFFPRPRAPFGTSGGAIALLTLPAALALAALLFARDLLIQDVIAIPGGAFTIVWGPLLPYLVTAPFYGALFYAIVVMMRRLEEAERAIERRQVTFVLAALILYAGYNTPFVLFEFGGAALGIGAVSEAAAREAALIAVIMLAGLAILARLARRLLARARSAPDAPARREARVVLLALALSAGVAVAVALVRAGGGPRVELRGLLRSGSVALIVYGIARYQLFDIDLRVKHAAAAAAAALAGAALAGAAWIALAAVSVPRGLGGGLSVILAAVAFVPLLQVATRLADRVAPAVSTEGDHLYLRKLEVYRATVEGHLREGREAREDDPWLSDVRGKLGLTARDHGVVVSLVTARAEAPRAALDLRPGSVVFGKYQIDCVIAEGGFGRVFLARDRILNRPVVLKELLAKWRGHDGVVRRFLQEAQIAGQLHHPNIVSVFEVEQQGQDYYVVMEHLPGGSLEDRLRAAGRLPEEEAVRVARAILDALSAAHARGVVHRDVKPANVLLGARGEVKLADFGIADLTETAAEVDRTISGLTSGGGGFHPGTLQYMSPEQARGLPLDAGSDLYAVGAVLYRALAGRPHVDLQGLDELAARNAIATAGPPAPLPGVSAAVTGALARALAPDPTARFPTAAAFAAALARAPLPPPGARE